jgi:hypothetical protein
MSYSRYSRSSPENTPSRSSVSAKSPVKMVAALV